jgi:hypothetical protein
MELKKDDLGHLISDLNEILAERKHESERRSDNVQQELFLKTISGLLMSIQILIDETRVNQRILIVAMCVLAGAREVLDHFYK